MFQRIAVLAGIVFVATGCYVHPVAYIPEHEPTLSSTPRRYDRPIESEEPVPPISDWEEID